MNNASKLRWLASTVVVTSLWGCASAPMPEDTLASSAAAIRSAQETGANSTPAAALELHYAELERAQAQRLLNDHDNALAALQLRRAEADANLALALTREATAAHALVATGDVPAPPAGTAR